MSLVVQSILIRCHKARMNDSWKKETKNLESSDIALLSVKELEALLKIDQKTIYRYVALGLIPYVRIQSNIRFRKRQIVRWIEEQQYEPELHSNVNRTH